MVICGAKKNSTISEISLNLIPDIFSYKYNNRIGDLLSLSSILLKEHSYMFDKPKVCSFIFR